MAPSTNVELLHVELLEVAGPRQPYQAGPPGAIKLVTYADFIH